MALNGVELGAMVELAFSELKVEDAGLVTTVASCPPIERDDACLVTGTFRHLNRDVMEVTFANSDLVIEPTWLHPLWSLDRNGWVRAGKLEPGERLKSEAGPLVVDTVRELPSSHVVYNLEVAGDHKYLVGADGLLSHNNNGCWQGGAKNALDHYKKHKDDFPHLNNAKEYVDEASDFVSNPPSSASVVTRQRDGTKVVYDPKSNRIGFQNKSGEPASYYKPDPSVHGEPSNMDYFQKVTR
jgi:hypothetical protein